MGAAGGGVRCVHRGTAPEAHVAFSLDLCSGEPSPPGLQGRAEAARPVSSRSAVAHQGSGSLSCVWQRVVSFFCLLFSRSSWCLAATARSGLRGS